MMPHKHYPILIHKDPDTDYGVTVPDLPGCFSAGSTIDEAMAMAREAIELHIEGLTAEGMPVPDPSPIEQLQRQLDHQDGTWALVSIDFAAPRATPAV